MKDFSEFETSDNLRNSIEECIKDAGEFPKFDDNANMSRYVQQIAFNVALETVHAYHEWLTPQLKR